jgi:SAM-dependent methyltransferase
MSGIYKSAQANANWLASPYGQSFIESERSHMDRALKLLTGPQVLLLGEVLDTANLEQLDFPHLVQVNTSLSRVPLSAPSSNNKAQRIGTQVSADPAFLPFDAGVFSSVVVPHVLEGHELPHQVLREAHRVLRSDGHLVLSGFNPYSLIGLQKLLQKKATVNGQFYSFTRVRDWLRLLGFELTGSAIYQYAPLCKSNRMRDATNFLNTVGDRWLPMTGGSYMITARKRDLGLTLIGPTRFSRKKRRPKLASAATSQANVVRKP